MKWIGIYVLHLGKIEGYEENYLSYPDIASLKDSIQAYDELL